MVRSLKKLLPRADELGRQLPYLPRAVALVWRGARLWTIAWLVLLVAQGLLPVATVYLTRAVVDSLVTARDAGADWDAIQPTLIWVALMALVLLINEVLRSVSNWVRIAQGELVSDHVSGLIHAQSVRLDLGFFESPAFYDQLHRARVDAIGRPVALLESMGGLAQNAITLVAMAAVLLTFGPWIPAVLVLSTLPALYVVARYVVRFNRWRVSNTTNERRTQYYDWLITWHESAAEIRLFALGEHYRRAYQTLRAQLRSGRLQLAKEQAYAEIAAGTVALLAMGATMGWMVWQAVRAVITLGDLALFFQAFNQGQRLMRSLLNNAGEVYRNLFFLENLFEFLALRPTVVTDTKHGSMPNGPISDGSKPNGDIPEGSVPNRSIPDGSMPMVLQGDIRFESVRFNYANSERAALDGLELTIPAGQIAAIVGANGSGKSTLIKLLCRFYDPQSGRIQVGDNDLSAFPLEDLRRQISVLFQQPAHYHETVADNIAHGDHFIEPSLDQIQAAARAAGADATIQRLPHSYQTVLGKWFGGSELSLGEWQRIALARAFLRQAFLIILDEPTSAMDSWAEADWLSRFRELVSGRTALIVTHRFTTALQADVIHVMDAGRIVESGTHGELMNKGGRYAQSWRQQTRGESTGLAELENYSWMQR